MVDNVRMNGALTYLAAARNRPNLEIVPDVSVDRVLIEDGRATGVIASDGRPFAARGVVLTAGAYGSPAILMRSGIGPAAHLRETGIPVTRDLAADVLMRFRQSVSSGSYIAISTACTDGMNPAVVSKVEAVYQNAAAQIVFRTGAQIEQLFEGLELVEPGLTDVTKWRIDEPTPQIHVTAGVGRKP